MASHNKNNSRKAQPKLQQSASVNRQMSKSIRPAPKQAKLKIGKWERMVANPLINEPVRTPSSSPFTGAVRTFVRTLSVSSGGNASPFSLSVRPSIQNTMALERATPIPFPDNWALAVEDAIITEFLFKGRQVMAGQLGLYDTDAESVRPIAEVETVIDDDGLPYYPISGAANTYMRVQFAGIAVKVGTSYRTAAGVWLGDDTGSALSGSYVSAAYRPGVVFTGLRFTTSPTSKMSFGMSSVSGDTVTAPATACYDIFQTDAITLGRVSTYRVTALSILASYSGNMFNNGGLIAAARVRKNYCYDENTPYNSLTKLQDHAYRGVLKDGAYVWWLPYSLDELNFRSPYSPVDDTELRMAGIFEDLSGQLQLTLTMTVEFYSPLQIFEHKVGPPLLDAFTAAYHILDGVPAATCNPKHTEILKGVLGTAKKAAGGAANLLTKHPELAYALLAMI